MDAKSVTHDTTAHPIRSRRSSSLATAAILASAVLALLASTLVHSRASETSAHRAWMEWQTWINEIESIHDLPTSADELREFENYRLNDGTSTGRAELLYFDQREELIQFVIERSWGSRDGKSALDAWFERGGGALIGEGSAKSAFVSDAAMDHYAGQAAEAFMGRLLEIAVQSR